MEEISEKKKAILEATLELVGEYGFHGTPMSLIAKESGVAAGTIYHYFSGKEELLNELYLYIKQKLIHYVDSKIQDELSYKEKFMRLWIDLHEFYSTHPSILFFFEQYVNSPYNKERSPHHFQGKFFHFLQSGIEEGQLKPVKPEILLAIFIGSVMASSKIRVFGSISFSDEDLSQAVEMLWNTISLGEN
ncbi:MAG TPA: TetR/AcrR family transcriptional regulator [Lunatimonas sp.]|nr:TetR/AcrR family transcriptional regulator [Lunatimonas sp.]